MLVKDIRKYEHKYYGCHNDMVIPELLCYYFEEEAYELVHYLAEVHGKDFAECCFYRMMAKGMLGYKQDAWELYKSNEGEWYHTCKQYGIYWKHVALYGLMFGDYNVSAYYQEVFDEHFDHECVEMLLLGMEEPGIDFDKIQKYKKIMEKYPVRKPVRENENTKGKKDIMTFEAIQWNLWNKYNLGIGNGRMHGIEKVYSKNGIEIYSYKPKEVSASMHIITDKESALILDCGCEMKDVEVEKIPVKKILDYLGIEKIDGVLISHAHMDHYGSLNEVKGTEVYMTRETWQLIKYISPEIYLGEVTIVEPGKNFSIKDIEIEYVSNGHIRGSAMIDIQWKKETRIVYTGDYSVEDQKTVKGFQINELLKNPKRVDVLITESTYGDKMGMLTLRQYETIFRTLCEKYVRYGNKIIIPVFAVGRCQEAALLLADVASENCFKILIDGMAAKITGYYQMSLGKNILNKNISVCNNEFDYEEKIFNNDIILASSGMMKDGSTSAKYVTKMIEESNVCIMKVGFIREGEFILKSVMNRCNNNLRLVDISLSAHTGYQWLVKVTERISPDCVIYVHGRGIIPPAPEKC